MVSQPMTSKRLQAETIGLTRLEQTELFFETLFILGILFFVYLTAVLTVMDLSTQPITMIQGHPTFQELVDFSPEIISSIFVGASLFLLVIVLFFLRQRMHRRQREVQLDHIIDHLHYIAQGHYQYRIPRVHNAELQRITNSINQLVDSTVEAMEEERRIEETKDELITNVSHDIRTPLTSVIGYLGLIENQRYEGDEWLEYTHIAYEKALHMQTLVNDLFDYTASNQPTFQAVTQVVPVEMYLTQLAADFELTAIQQGVDIQVQVDPDDLVADMDVEKMARVFGNLINNALKYGVGAQTIELRAQVAKTYQERLQAQARLALTKGTSLLIFEVANDGEPVPEEELDLIFQRSYRGDKSRTSDQPGSGLGLSIVQNIVELHGGRVYAFHRGPQTVFRIEMPQYQGQGGGEAGV